MTSAPWISASIQSSRSVRPVSHAVQVMATSWAKRRNTISSPAKMTMNSSHIRAMSRWRSHNARRPPRSPDRLNRLYCHVRPSSFKNTSIVLIGAG